MKKNFYSLLFLLLFASCKKDIPQKQLTINVTPDAGGTVSPKTGIYALGTTVKILATPSAEYVFKEWTGGYSGSTNPANVIMDEDKIVNAVFEKREYPLSLTIVGSGTVKEEIIKIAPASTNYKSGTTVRLTPQQRNGYEFKGWSGDDTTSRSPLDIVISKATNLTCTFEKEDAINFKTNLDSGTYKVVDTLPLLVSVISKLPKAGIVYSILVNWTDSSKQIFKLDTSLNVSSLSLKIPGLKSFGSYTVSVTVTSKSSSTNTLNKTISVVNNTLESGLQLYYPFNGNILDESGNGNDGAVYWSLYPGGPITQAPNLTLTTDRALKLNSAYHFDGQTNSLRVYPKKMQLNGYFSISCWVYLENLQPRYNDEAIIGQWNGPLGIGNNFLLSYRNYVNDYGIGLYINQIGNFTKVWDINNYSLYQKNWYIPESAKWYHIVVTYSQGNVAQFYVNGRLQLNTSNVPTTFILPNNFIEIGHAYNANQDLWFNGSLDEIRLYNRVLSQAEITYLYSH